VTVHAPVSDSALAAGVTATDSAVVLRLLDTVADELGEEAVDW